MKCNVCGQEVRGAHNFCTNCGAQIEVPTFLGFSDGVDDDSKSASTEGIVSADVNGDGIYGVDELAAAKSVNEPDDDYGKTILLMPESVEVAEMSKIADAAPIELNLYGNDSVSEVQGTTIDYKNTVEETQKSVFEAQKIAADTQESVFEAQKTVAAQESVFEAQKEVVGSQEFISERQTVAETQDLTSEITENLEHGNSNYNTSYQNKAGDIADQKDRTPQTTSGYSKTLEGYTPSYNEPAQAQKQESPIQQNVNPNVAGIQSQQGQLLQNQQAVYGQNNQNANNQQVNSTNQQAVYGQTNQNANNPQVNSTSQQAVYGQTNQSANNQQVNAANQLYYGGQPQQNQYYQQGRSGHPQQNQYYQQGQSGQPQQNQYYQQGQYGQPQQNQYYQQGHSQNNQQYGAKNQYGQYAYNTAPTQQVAPASMAYIKPSKFRSDLDYTPISAWGYVGYNILFFIPLVGFIFMLVFACGGTKNANLRSYSRSFFCTLLLVIIIVCALIGVCLAIGANYLHYLEDIVDVFKDALHIL